MYYAFGMQWEGAWMYDEPVDSEENRYRYNGKEYSKGSRLSDYGARYYSSDIGRWNAVDPLADAAPALTPYRYGFNNPMRFTDPNGLFEDDPIYDRNGNEIGDDGKTDGKAYIATGSKARQVKKATEAGECYTGSLKDKNVYQVPTGGVMDDVISSVNDTKMSGREQGGHATIGSENATRWNEGSEPLVRSRHPDGSPAEVGGSIIPFKVGDVIIGFQDYNTVEFYWHTHQDVMLEGIQLGSAEPSPNDFSFQRLMVQRRGYNGIPFLIGTNTNQVTYYNHKRSKLTISYDTFKRNGKAQ